MSTLLPPAPRTRSAASAGRRAEISRTVADGGSAAFALRRQRGELRVVWVNQAAAELVGVTEGDALTDLLSDDFIHELPHWAELLPQLIGASLADEWHSAAIDAPDPATSGVQVRVRAAGDGVHVVWLRPMTDRERLAEQAQRESEHRFSALAEDAPVGIIASEAGIRLGFVNRRFAQIAGMEPSMLLGTRWLKAIHAEDVPALQETLDEVLSGSAAEVTLRMLSVVDTPRLVQVRLSPVTTPRRSAGFIGTVEDITARHAWEAQLTYQATHDPLTGLANRRSLMDSMAELLASRRRRDGDLAVMFCDLDGFKKINDQLGHDAGDRVLIEVAQRLTATAREHDVVARMAGDEFVVLLTGINGYADAEAAAIRQLRALTVPFRVGGRQLQVSTSIGIAMAHDFDGARQLLQAADHGMYEAKRTGAGLYRRATATADGSHAA